MQRSESCSSLSNVPENTLHAAGVQASQQNVGQHFAAQLRRAAADAEHLLLLPQKRVHSSLHRRPLEEAMRDTCGVVNVSEAEHHKDVSAASIAASAKPLLRLLNLLRPFAAALDAELSCRQISSRSSNDKGNSTGGSAKSSPNAVKSRVTTTNRDDSSNSIQQHAAEEEQASTFAAPGHNVTASGRGPDVEDPTAAAAASAETGELFSGKVLEETGRRELHAIIHSYISVSPTAEELLSLFQVLLLFWPASLQTSPPVMLARPKKQIEGSSNVSEEHQRHITALGPTCLPSPEPSAAAAAAALTSKLEALTELIILLLRYLVASVPVDGSSRNVQTYVSSVPSAEHSRQDTPIPNVRAITRHAIAAAITEPSRLHALGAFLQTQQQHTFSAAEDDPERKGGGGRGGGGGGGIALHRRATSVGVIVASGVSHSPYVRLACWKLLCAVVAADVHAAVRVSAALNCPSSNSTHGVAANTQNTNIRDRKKETEEAAAAPSLLWGAVAAALQGPQQKLLQQESAQKLRRNHIWKNPWLPSGFATNVAVEYVSATTALSAASFYSSSRSVDREATKGKSAGLKHGMDVHPEKNGCWSVAWGRTFTRCCCLSRCCSPAIATLFQKEEEEEDEGEGEEEEEEEQQQQRQQQQQRKEQQQHQRRGQRQPQRGQKQLQQEQQQQYQQEQQEHGQSQSEVGQQHKEQLQQQQHQQHESHQQRQQGHQHRQQYMNVLQQGDHVLQQSTASGVSEESVAASAHFPCAKILSADAAAAVVCAAVKHAAAAHPYSSCLEAVPQRYAVRQRVLQLLLVLLLHPEKSVSWLLLQQPSRRRMNGPPDLTETFSGGHNSSSSSSSKTTGFNLLLLASLSLPFDRRLDALVWMVGLRQAIMRLQRQHQRRPLYPRILPLLNNDAEERSDRTAAARVAVETNEVETITGAATAQTDIGAVHTMDAVGVGEEDVDCAFSCTAARAKADSKTATMLGTSALLEAELSRVDGAAVPTRTTAAAAKRTWRRLNSRRPLLRVYARLLHMFTAKESAQQMLKVLLLRLRSGSESQWREESQGQQKKHWRKQHEHQEQPFENNICDRRHSTQQQELQDGRRQQGKFQQEKLRHKEVQFEKVVLKGKMQLKELRQQATQEENMQQEDHHPCRSMSQHREKKEVEEISAAWLLQELLFECMAAAFAAPYNRWNASSEDEACKEEQQKQRELLQLEFLQQLRPIFLPPQQELLLRLLRKAPLRAEAQQQLLQHLSTCIHLAPRQSAEFALSQLLIARLIALLPQAAIASLSTSFFPLLVTGSSSSSSSAAAAVTSATLSSVVSIGDAQASQTVTAAPATAASVYDAYMTPLEEVQELPGGCTVVSLQPGRGGGAAATTATALATRVLTSAQLAAAALTEQLHGQLELFHLQAEADNCASRIIPFGSYLRQHLSAALLHASPYINLLGLLLLRSCCCGFLYVTLQLYAAMIRYAASGNRRAAGAVEDLLLPLAAAVRDRLPDEKTLSNCFSRLLQQNVLQQQQLSYSATSHRGGSLPGSATQEGATSTSDFCNDLVQSASFSGAVGSSAIPAAAVSASVAAADRAAASSFTATDGRDIWPVDEVLLLQKKARRVAKRDDAAAREQKRKPTAPEEEEIPEIHIEGLEEDEEDHISAEDVAENITRTEGRKQQPDDKETLVASRRSGSETQENLEIVGNYTLEGGAVCLEDVLQAEILLICCCNSNPPYSKLQNHSNLFQCNRSTETVRYSKMGYRKTIFPPIGSQGEAAECFSGGGYVGLLLMARGFFRQQQQEGAQQGMQNTASSTKNCSLYSSVAQPLSVDGPLLFTKYVL